ncbi:alpha-L-fucosidase-like isoform X1 [Limulus polyphemus]|uniref:alpha-L-fucosidase n=1 Tax=Limulus polyphemus TaxID=6850 RepID=A0ABM1B715_LIMPO|nr:alpha-L-fucosidase-like isoform X1 [Limulus polyphemus]
MFSLASLLVLGFVALTNSQYQPTWKSIDSRPLPSWYDDSKVGIFIHWGVFSVPSFGSEWFWEQWQQRKLKPFVDFMDRNYKPNFTYAAFAPSFTCEFYDPEQWADIFNASGARYVVLTSKHHEGYTLWPSKVSWNWNAVDVGPKRDLLGDLANAIRKKTNIRFGVYHSLFEWFHPLYLYDKSNDWKSQLFVKAKTMPELIELVNIYKPEVIWSDGDWEAPDTYWNSRGFLAWLYNKSPVKNTVVVNDRWGSGIACHHGGFFTCQDKYNPGKLQNRKWEDAMTLDKSSWGYRRTANLEDYLSMEELVSTLAETVSCGGNILINVGPTHDGRIIPIFEERLRNLGKWLSVNGEAVYESRPWTYQNDTVTPNIWYTKGGKNAVVPSVYVFVLNWPKNNQLYLGAPVLNSNSKISMLGVKDILDFKKDATGGIMIYFPQLTPDVLPCQWAWVLKMQGVVNYQ